MLADHQIYVSNINHSRLFGFVARKQGSTTDNISHLFAEMDPGQPASAIVNFVLKMISSQKRWELSANPGTFYFESLWLFSLLLTNRHFLVLDNLAFHFTCHLIFPTPLRLSKHVCVCVCVWANVRESVCGVCVCGTHACAFLLGRTPEWTRGSAEWGVAVCDNGTGGDLDLPGRVTREEGMMLREQMSFAIVLFFNFLKEEVKLCDV